MTAPRSGGAHEPERAGAGSRRGRYTAPLSPSLSFLANQPLAEAGAPWQVQGDLDRGPVAREAGGRNSRSSTSALRAALTARASGCRRRAPAPGARRPRSGPRQQRQPGYPPGAGRGRRALPRSAPWPSAPRRPPAGATTGRDGVRGQQAAALRRQGLQPAGVGGTLGEGVGRQVRAHRLAVQPRRPDDGRRGPALAPQRQHALVGSPLQRTSAGVTRGHGGQRWGPLGRRLGGARRLH